jgi:16S rRNA (guanine527-N7)-methyltransferase
MPNDELLFEKYLVELIAWNQKFNLTAITDPEGIKTKHFADSLLLTKRSSMSAPEPVFPGSR